MSSDRQQRIATDGQSSGFQGPGQFPGQVHCNAMSSRAYESWVCIGGHLFKGFLYDQSRAIFGVAPSADTYVIGWSVGPGYFPVHVSAPVLLQRIQMDTAVGGYAYIALVIIRGRIFIGILYDRGPHQQLEGTADFVTRENYLAEEQMEDSGSKKTRQCSGVANPEQSRNQGQATIENPSSECIEEVSDSKKTEQCMGAVTTETSGNQGQVTIDDLSSENILEDSGSKEIEEEPEVEGQVTIDNPSSEDSGSNKNEQEPEVEGQVTVDSPSSEEDSGSKANEQEPEVEGHTCLSRSVLSCFAPLACVFQCICSHLQENIEDDSGCKENEQEPEVEGQVTIDNPSLENIEDSGSEENNKEPEVVGQVTIDNPSSENIEEDWGSKENEQVVGVAIDDQLSANPESSGNQQVNMHDQSSGPGDFPSQVILTATCSLVYQSRVDIGGHIFSGILYDQGPIIFGSLDIENLPSQDNGPLTFRLIQMDNAVGQYAYHARGAIGNHSFAGILYDYGPHHQSEGTSYLHTRENYSSHQRELHTRTTANPQTSEKQGQVTIDDPSSEVSGLNENDQGLVSGSTETSANQGQITIDDPSEEQKEDSSSKEADQSLGVANPETSANQGQTTTDNPSSEYIEEEISDFKETNQWLGAAISETSVNQGQVTIDHRSSDEQNENSTSRETDQCLGVANPETSTNQGQVTIDNPSSEYIEASDSKETDHWLGAGISSVNQGHGTIDDDPSSDEQMKEDSTSKETDRCLDVAKPEPSSNKGQGTIDNPSSEYVEEPSDSKETGQWLGAGISETSVNQGQVTIEFLEEEVQDPKETEHCLGAVSIETSATQSQVTIDDPSSEKQEEPSSMDIELLLAVDIPETSASQGQVTIDYPVSGSSESGSKARKHMVFYEFLEFTYGPLVTATDNFADCISEGYYGPLYRGTYLDKEVAVKLLNKAVTGFSGDDVAKLARRIGRASHPNIVKFVGYCNDQLDRHMLVYEFIPTTLSSYLHGSEPQMPTLDWATRMHILHGVARALDYLHYTVKPRVIYGDLSSFNILLEGSLLLSKLCGFGVGKLKHNEYCSYEHALSDEVSAKCDIFCFGLVLLELLTGRKAYDAATGASRPWLLDWVKAKVACRPRGLQDPALKGKVDQSTFGRALKFAILCTKKHSRISDIHEVLSDTMDYITCQTKDEEDLSLEPSFLQNFESESAEEEEKTTNKNELEPEASGNQLGQVTIDDQSSEKQEESSSKVSEQLLGGATKHMVSYEFLEFTYGPLVTATGNFADRISEGSYGSLYKGTYLDKEVAVKLLNKAVTGFSGDDIAKLARRIGRAGHDNIVTFVGYCNDQLDRHMLVYEFIPTALHSYLHGPEPQMPPLDWDTRMNILHGVATTLDYLHNTVKPRVIYGHLNSSNILLEGSSLHPKLCGFGFRKFRHDGYCSYEHTRSDEVSIKCDIFCFGLLLLELLTGRKAYDATSRAWLIDWVKVKVACTPRGLQDPALKGKVDRYTFGKALKFAILCVRKRCSISGNCHVLSDSMDILTGRKEDEEVISLGYHFTQNFES